MRHWFKDPPLRSLLRNSSYLGISRAVAAVAGIATLAFAGRGLGLMLLGTLILITSYAKAVSGLAKFQSWQVIVRFGGHGIAHGTPDNFKLATGFALSLDFWSGFAGMVVAILLLPWVAAWVGIDQQYLWLAALYCTLLPVMGSATPSGVLRVLDRFDLIGWADVVNPISRAFLAMIAFLLDAPFAAYVVIWYVTDLIGDLVAWFFAWRQLRRTGHLKGIRPTLRPEGLPGAWRFAINVNLAVSVATIWGPVGRLAVGGLLGPAGAALFRVASTLAGSAQKPADLLGRAFYPEIVRMDFSTKRPWKLMRRVIILSSGIAAIAIGLLVLFGKPLLGGLFGESFLGAYEPLLLMMAIPFLGIFSFPLAPMLYALGRSDAPLKAKLAASGIFFVALAPLCWSFDVMGAAAALVIGNVANVAILLIQLRGEHGRVRGRPSEARLREAASASEFE